MRPDLALRILSGRLSDERARLTLIARARGRMQDGRRSSLPPRAACLLARMPSRRRRRRRRASARNCCELGRYHLSFDLAAAPWPWSVGRSRSRRTTTGQRRLPMINKTRWHHTCTCVGSHRSPLARTVRHRADRNEQVKVSSGTEIALSWRGSTVPSRASRNVLSPLCRHR